MEKITEKKGKQQGIGKRWFLVVMLWIMLVFCACDYGNSDAYGETGNRTPTPAPTMGNDVPRPTPGANSEDSGEEDSTEERHRHRWVEITEDKAVYNTVNVYIYTCNRCGITFSDKAEANEHTAKAEQNHGGYDGNIHIDTQFVAQMGFACKDNECGFTTADRAAMEAHAAANSKNEDEHVGYDAERTIYVDVLGFKCNGCDFSTQNEAEIKTHDAEHCSYEVVSEQVYHFTCASCGWEGVESGDHGVMKPDCPVKEENLTPVPVVEIWYVCKNESCYMATESLDEIRAHGRENHPELEHGGYQSNVKIGTTSQTIKYYKCNNCDFETDDIGAMSVHQQENQAMADHGGYHSNVQIGVQGIPIMGYACRAGDFRTPDEAAMKEHDAANDGKGHDITESVFDTIQEYVRTDQVGTGKYKCSECGQER